MENSKIVYDQKQFNWWQVVLYCLLPAIPITLIALACAAPWGLGLPIVLSMMIGIGLGCFPVQWGIIFLTAKKQGKPLKSLFGYKEKIKKLELFLWVSFSVVIALFVMIMLAPLENKMWGAAFNWFPDWFRLDKANVKETTTTILVITLILNFVLNGVLAPITEEYYFRAFLTPRMEKFGKLAWLLSLSMFSLYHFWAPWELFSRILALLLPFYLVWLKKDFRISIFTHVTMNTLSCFAMLMGVLG